MTDNKDLKELSPEEFKELKLEFAPGCFDSFEGTQEELDELVAQIKEMFASGEAQQLARPIDVDELTEEDLETIEHLQQIEENLQKRTLQ